MMSSSCHMTKNVLSSK